MTVASLQLMRMRDEPPKVAPYVPTDGGAPAQKGALPSTRAKKATTKCNELGQL